MKNPFDSLVFTGFFVTGVFVLVVSIALSFVYERSYSIDAWRNYSHYKGPVCLVNDDGRSCSNGVPYSISAEKAGESYLIWKGCKLNGSEYDCKELND